MKEFCEDFSDWIDEDSESKEDEYTVAVIGFSPGDIIHLTTGHEYKVTARVESCTIDTITITEVVESAPLVTEEVIRALKMFKVLSEDIFLYRDIGREMDQEDRERQDLMYNHQIASMANVYMPRICRRTGFSKSGFIGRIAKSRKGR